MIWIRLRWAWSDFVIYHGWPPRAQSSVWDGVALAFMILAALRAYIVAH